MIMLIVGDARSHAVRRLLELEKELDGTIDTVAAAAA